MKQLKKSALIFVCALALCTMTACGSRDNTTVEDPTVGDTLKDDAKDIMDDTGDALEDGVDDLKDGAKDVKDSMRDNTGDVDDTVNDATKNSNE